MIEILLNAQDLPGEVPRPRIVVLGGVVMDLVFKVPTLPEWRHAVQAHSFNIRPGGKGLNQAVACSKLGAEVSIISAIGRDEYGFGRRISSLLEEQHIDDRFVVEVQEEPTAVTNVLVNYAAEAAFVGWKGVTRTRVDANLVKRAAKLIQESNAILITLEVSLGAVEEAIAIAKSDNDRHPIVVLNPAPPLEVPDSLPNASLLGVDVLVPNQWEAAELVSDGTNVANPGSLAVALHGMGVGIVCVTTSKGGCVVADDNRGVTLYPPFRCNPRDMTGGSDAFCATLGVELGMGRKLEEAISRAGAAEAISIEKLSPYPSMPSKEELDRFLGVAKRTGLVRKIPLQSLDSVQGT